jgi:hypothetical protein
MVTVDANIPFLIYIGIPLLILFIGITLSYLKSKKRKSIGIMMILIGILEFSTLLVISNFSTTIGIFYLTPMLTIALGVLSLYSKPTPKN